MGGAVPPVAMAVEELTAPREARNEGCFFVEGCVVWKVVSAHSWRTEVTRDQVNGSGADDDGE